ncbi:hypothetical protein BCR32DRAFT_329315 [Anaeromyces robustus]|uniref:3-hydroxyacyl-CoA dehydrogenase n=1 Tax=Anaeromyces robustus TaxID=1754192 RepID=A0A1Y1WSM6_9FUNG|nr:hypothetical protein BCR32DRAFT_329315 [Anaeromyces robustus]|eukprot:ORX76541.1 hypothetical protein BCR32DRAFT_329315 [Anaeromyces robustus]
MTFNKIVVVGGGVLGSQIAFQTAYCGFDVTILLRSEASIERSKPKIESLKKTYLSSIDQMENKLEPYFRGLTKEKELNASQFNELRGKVEKAYKEIKLTTNFEEACHNADLIIESISEIIQEKINLYKKLSEIMEEKTFIVSNTSQLLPSELAPHTSRPEKFLNLHFANSIYRNNTAEIMGHPGTDENTYQEIIQFAEQINMVPLRLNKENRGYILSALLNPFLDASRQLWATGVADPETIDKCWKLSTSSPVGPFFIMDMIGLKTSYNVKLLNPKAREPGTIEYLVANKLKEMIDQGKLGISSGEGFYKYR